MCGRFIITAYAETIKEIFKANILFDYQPRYNVAPGQDVPVVVEGGSGAREISAMRWGLIPSWARDPGAGYKMINARAETIGQKPAYRVAFKHRRCLIPADGFYEWIKAGNKKLPLLITIPGRKVFALAGIWERWVSPGGENIDSFSIITTAANGFMQGIHHRMPVILSIEDEYVSWLETGATKNSLMKPFGGSLEAYYVSTLVNTPKFDGLEIVKELRPYVPGAIKTEQYKLF